MVSIQACERRNESAPVGARRSRMRWALALVLLALAIIFLPEVARVTLGSNFHTVLERRCYRAAQPSGSSLESYINTYGIRTVINLRGPNPGEDWYDEELKAAQRHEVPVVSVNMSASDKPQEKYLRELVETLDQCREPILIHCNSGSDRSGLASACYLLLKTETSLKLARSQLSLRYGHIPWSKAACQSQVLDQYQTWLDSQRQSHQPSLFLGWAREFYVKDDWPEDVKR